MSEPQSVSHPTHTSVFHYLAADEGPSAGPQSVTGSSLDAILGRIRGSGAWRDIGGARCIIPNVLAPSGSTGSLLTVSTGGEPRHIALLHVGQNIVNNPASQPILGRYYFGLTVSLEQSFMTAVENDQAGTGVPNFGTRTVLYQYPDSRADFEFEHVSKLLRSLVDPLAGFDRFGERGWDGVGAEPVTTETLDCARKISAALPTQYGDPHAAPGADGSIGLYWSDQPSFRALCIDIGPGEVWRAYWETTDGSFGSFPSHPCDDKLSGELAKLFSLFSSHADS